MSSAADLWERDSRLLWHPYTQHGLGVAPLPVVAGQGAYLHLADGRKILDAISSWWVNLHGHAHPAIAEAVARQARTLEQVIFAGFTHEPALRLAEILVTATRERGAKLDRVFYSDNGSTAVEVALKMAYQFHLNRGAAGRQRFIALSGAYHGDTLGAMAVGEPTGFHARFRPLLPAVDFVPPDDVAALERLLAEWPGQHAALIVEPMIQGAEGMRIHSAAYLREAERLCRQAGVLLICDEVFTGFHRTGRCFAFEHADLRPDLLCVSKGLTGGFLPLAATLATEEVYAAFLSDDKAKAFLHGHSYTANPLACAAALASWELLQSEECQGRIRSICERTRKHIGTFAGHPRVRDARALGTIGALDVVLPAGPSGYFADLGPKIYEKALERGVLLRPLGDVLYAVPPYCAVDDEIDAIYRTMRELIDLLPETGQPSR